MFIILWSSNILIIHIIFEVFTPYSIQTYYIFGALFYMMRFWSIGDHNIIFIWSFFTIFFINIIILSVCSSIHNNVISDHGLHEWNRKTCRTSTRIPFDAYRLIISHIVVLKKPAMFVMHSLGLDARNTMLLAIEEW